MDLDLTFERVYPHPVEWVWEAVATREGLAAWLMENDFEPEIGHAFTFRFCPEDGSEATTAVEATVLEIEEPRRIVWSWRNEGETAATRVEIVLEEVASGTKVILRHTGPISAETGDTLKRGWPAKFDELRRALGR
jgi:uncharacterized protein YndB with AHSA1/START domain